jgi:hypothetical protein
METSTSKESYLMTNINLDISNNLLNLIKPYTNFHPDLILIPNFLSESELVPLESKIHDIRSNIDLSLINEQSVGMFDIKSESFKYICHQRGRYDIWNISDFIKIPSFLEKFTRKSIGALLVDSNTLTDGLFHKDTIKLFDTITNHQLPPFYYNMLIALTEQTKENGPTQFLINDTIYWVPMKRGDVIVFNGELIHRGSANRTMNHRDMIYAIFTTTWYDEEKL